MKPVVCRLRSSAFQFWDPEWLQEFRENFVHERVPEHRYSHASSSHEASLQHTCKRREDLGKHSVYTHFPKDRNCEICQRTKIAGSPCRRRSGGAVPRAEKFGDLINADHKVLSENCESRNNHRYAIVVQDLATQWIQSYPCETKTSQETQRSLHKFLDPDRKPKVIHTDNSMEFGKACEDISWKHCTSTPHRSETNGITERVVRRVKEGTSAVLLQSGLNENWWADSMECFSYLRNVIDLLSDGNTPTGWVSPYNYEGPFKDPSIWRRKSYLDCSSDTICTRGEFGRVRYWLHTFRSWKRRTHRKSTRKSERGDISQTGRIYFFQSQMDESKPLEEIRNWEHPPRYGIDQFKERVTLTFLENQKGLFHHLTTHFRMLVKQ